MASPPKGGVSSGTTEVSDTAADARELRRARLLRLRQLAGRPEADRGLIDSEISQARIQFGFGSADGLPDDGAGQEADGELRLALPTIEPPDAAPPPKDSPKVTVIAFSVTHNHLARAYILADLLRSRYRVELVGPMFRKYGDEIWKPLQRSRVPIKWFHGMNLPAYFEQIAKVANRIDSDAIIVSKPMLPSYLLGIFLKKLRNRPLILDIDDFETGAFVGTSQSAFEAEPPATLASIRHAGRDEDLREPYGELWTRYCDSIADLADAVTVANPALQARYGGVLIPQVRDEGAYDPALYDRDAIRAELGYRGDDRVILFLGTPYWHKGVHRVADALRELGNDRYKLCIIGSILDDDLRAELSRLDNGNIRFLPDRFFHDTPASLCLADLVCLLQDPAHATASHQMPAKFVDALAMGVPMLGTRTPPLIDAAKDGLIELLGDEPLHERIDAIFTNHAGHKERAMRNREAFRKQYSYAAGRAKLVEVIESLIEAPPPLPAEFSRLLGAFDKGLAKRETVKVPVL